MRPIVLRIAILLMFAGAAGQASLRCNWGILSLTPTVFPTSVQVMATPVVMNFGGSGPGQVAFVSFGTNNNANQDSGGVLRIIDSMCGEIARFPDPANTACPCTPPANAPANFCTTPDLAPLSGLAAGNIDQSGGAEIIAVIGGGSPNHKQIAAFNLVGNCIVPKWVSSAAALPAADFIPTSAPAIAQLDRPPAAGWNNAEIVIDNKVFNSDGTLRYTGFSGGGNNCATLSGGAPCPRSRTAIVANVLGQALPQVITGRGIYASTSSTT